MKVLIIQWNSYGNLVPVYERRGTDVVECVIDTHASGEAERARETAIRTAVSEVKPDYVFSYNYFPYVSNICQEVDVPYVSWVYDSPYMDVYSFTVPNPVNHIFLFDYGVYQQFQSAGIETVHYLPLGVRCADVDASILGRNNYQADISFVGSLYSEPKHRLYDKFAALPPYAKGYLDALIEAQKHIYGENILENILSDDLINQMEQCYPTDPNPTSAMTPRQIYAQYVLSRQVTSIERRDILEKLGALEIGSDRLTRNLYTWEKSISITGWNNLGDVDYYSQMPSIFHNSKINLNITLRSILTGIPLRAWDIMAAGGFLISNYQAEFPEYFTLGEDMVVYEDYDDLMNKVEYYLSHNKEREEIAANGYNKVATEHTVDNRIDEIERSLL